MAGAMSKPRFLGFTADGRRRYAADYELPPMRGGSNGGDPSSDDQVAASSDDACENEVDGGAYTDGDVYIYAGSSSRNWGAIRFINGPFPAQDSAIDVAYIEVYVFNASYDDVNVDIHA